MKTKQVFVTDDGKEFGSEAEANQYENIKEAYDVWESACNKLNEAYMGQLRTADGHPFLLNKWWQDYYYVHDGWARISIETVTLRRNSFEISYDTQEPTVVIIDWDAKGGVKVIRRIVSNLFYIRKEAEKRRVELLKRRIEWLQEDLEKAKTLIK